MRERFALRRLDDVEILRYLASSDFLIEYTPVDISTLVDTPSMIAGKYGAPFTSRLKCLRFTEPAAGLPSGETLPTGYWANMPKFVVSDMKSVYGKAATKEAPLKFEGESLIGAPDAWTQKFLNSSP